MSEYTATFVGTSFVKQYYTVMHDSPALLHKFYDDDSRLTHIDERERAAGRDSGETGEVVGRDAIQKKISSLGTCAWGGSKYGELPSPPCAPPPGTERTRAPSQGASNRRR